MAAGSLARPGRQFGPCKSDCSHKDCAETRRMASTPCRICAKEIGYDRRFFRETGDILVHEVCALEEIERERAAA